ncbi:MAG: DMT family transporter [candidate division Zixibacteria bacterium]|nr:DMT family transporter [candidate division Zixibacteria bacterium]
MNPPFPYLGEIISVGAALTWAFAVILFRKSGETVHPIALNVFKNILAITLLFPTIWLSGGVAFSDVPGRDCIMILISGVLGIGISDTLFFMSLNRIGAGMSAIINCLYSPFIIALSMVWIDESLTLFQLIGVAMIVSAVLTATSRKGAGHLSRSDLVWGVVFGILALVAMAVGIVMIKPILNRTPLLVATQLRLLGGMAALIIYLLLHPKRRAILGSINSIGSWKYTVTGSFIGTYITLILWMGGMKYTQVSIAAALSQLSNVFTFTLAVLFLREPLNLWRIFGIILGVGGALVVILA